MEPIPETRVVVDEFGPLTDTDDLLDYLDRCAVRVRAVVPTCVGITLSSFADGLAFTLVATDTEVAALDGIQYLDDGPCVTGGREGQALAYDADDPTDERRWQLFAQATAARNVASTLTLPIRDGGVVTGTVNLYASTSKAFDDHHDALAGIFGAWAAGAVTNADLGFESRRAAQQAPALIRRQLLVSEAVGRLAAAKDIAPDKALALLSDSARRAAVEVEVIAAVVLDALRTGGP